MTMTHPGLPAYWGEIISLSMAVMLLYVYRRPLAPANTTCVRSGGNLVTLPLVGSAVRRLVRSHWILPGLKLLMAGLFLLIIAAGLYGTPIAEKNIATVLTWNLWWAGLVFSVFFLGSAWCAICPWDTLAQWLVKHRLWRRAENAGSLELNVPRTVSHVWGALLLFIILTWLELGVGITTNPYATALVSLLMIVLATASLAIFKRKAFCRYFCPIGRTIGFYSQLSPVELRPIDPQVCANCRTLDCYHGNGQVEGCPTGLVMGRLTQNTYCTSCGNCTQSCPHHNIAWRVRPVGHEALHSARPHWDEAWFMVGLLALTGFHGLTMMPFWEDWMSQLARLTGDSGRLLTTFTLGFVAVMAVIGGFYALTTALTQRLMKRQHDFRRIFSGYAFVALPMAFCYHMAHNLNHLIRESGGIGAVFRNPLGIDARPLSMMEKHQRHLDMWLSQDALFAIQALLMIAGFWLAIQVIRHRGRELANGTTTATPPQGLALLPMLVFTVVITGFHLWLLMQPMTMRM